MRITEVCRAWVVYRMTLPKNVMGGNVVCEHREWEAVEAARPGYHILLHSGIKTEREAEMLARGAADEPKPVGDTKKAEIAPLFATVVSAQPSRELTPRTPRRRTGSRAA